MIRINLLKAKQAENEVNNKVISAKIGMSEQQLSKILNNKVRLDLNKAIEIGNAIGLTKSEFFDIFLSEGFTGGNTA